MITAAAKYRTLATVCMLLETVFIGLYFSINAVQEFFF